MDKQNFQRWMTYLAAAYSKEITTEQAAVYWDQLGNLDDRVFGDAVRTLVSENRRFPTVAEVREAYKGHLRRMDMNANPHRLQQTPRRSTRKTATDNIIHIREVLAGK